MKKKLLAILLAVLMVVSLLPMTALAEGHDHSGWTEWTSSDSLPTEAGRYYLSADVTLDGTWEAPAGTSGAAAVTDLCLNGHAIALDDAQDGSVVIVPEYAELNIYDCTDTLHNGYLGSGGLWNPDAGNAHGGLDDEYDITGGYITGGKGIHYSDEAIEYGFTEGGGVFVFGTFNLYGGALCGNMATMGAGAYVCEGGSVTVDGGSICGNIGGFSEYLPHFGAGVYVAGSLTLNGGSISNNTANGENAAVFGGGVYINGGDFTMTDGEVSGNKACAPQYGDVNGGGVYVDNGGSFLMEGGKISGNTVDNYYIHAFACGGGVHINDENSSFTMNGGEISGNYAREAGGGVYNQVGNVTLTGGIICNNVSEQRAGIYAGAPCLGGDIKIINNNKTNGKPSNLTLSGKATFGTGPDGNGVAVPAEGMEIGISLDYSPTATTAETFAFNATEAYAAYFKADVSFEEVSFNTNNNYLELVLSDEEGNWKTFKNEVENAADGSTVTLTEDIVAVNDDERIVISLGKEITIDLNGHTLDRNYTSSYIFYLDQNATLTLKNGTVANAGDKIFSRINTGRVIDVALGGTLLCEDVTFLHTSSGMGGVIDSKNAKNITLKNTDFIGCEGVQYPLIKLKGIREPILIQDCEFVGSYTEYTGDYLGSVVYIDESAFTIDGCTFKDNKCYSDPASNETIPSLFYLADLETVENEHIIKDCTITDNFVEAIDAYVIYNACSEIKFVGDCVISDKEGKASIELALRVLDLDNYMNPIIENPFMASVDISGLTHEKVSLPHLELDLENIAATKYYLSALSIEYDPFAEEHKILSGLPTDSVITIDGKMAPFTCYQVDDDIMAKVIAPSIDYDDTTITADADLELDTIAYDWYSIKKGNIALTDNDTLGNLGDLGGVFSTLPAEEAAEMIGMYEFPSIFEGGSTELPPLCVGFYLVLMGEIEPYFSNAVLAKSFVAGDQISIKAEGLPAGAKLSLVNINSLLFGSEANVLAVAGLTEEEAIEEVGSVEAAVDMVMGMLVGDLGLTSTNLETVELAYDAGTGAYAGELPTSETYILVVDAGGAMEPITCEITEVSALGMDMSTKQKLAVTENSFEPEESTQDTGYYCDIVYPRSWIGTLGGTISTSFVTVPGVAPAEVLYEYELTKAPTLGGGKDGTYSISTYYLDNNGEKVYVEKNRNTDVPISFESWYLRTMYQYRTINGTLDVRFVSMLGEFIDDYAEAGFVFRIDDLDWEQTVKTNELYTTFLADGIEQHIEDYSRADDYFFLQNTLFSEDVVKENYTVSVYAFVTAKDGTTYHGAPITFNLADLI